MSDNARTTLLIGRISALCLIGLAVAYGVGGASIEYAFSSDPLGPRVVPVALATVLGLLCLFYLRSPGTAEAFPSGRLLWRVLAIPLLLVVCVAIFETVGFAMCIFLLTFGTGLIFGAPLGYAAAGAAGHAALWWFIFSYLLQVYLPTGTLFG
ncbi:tripartite tricarboxylate transporter TctB family protein [Mesorhizobium sp. SARCC-RB16n]|uniref:tripartite tricarboxylate transporter TctB family protein n=1 Tax=Mesorhizobium sp. SARCC-RB16n TaxID=2116687 RepID=UPI00122F6A18|nr:tripartite tricarboxylate transporter TctB family protein [Mesorhizobium sp. SARCC-RB16n]KAA3449729.1 tripartite tricarboxylate transporter TctB family protein [Mesorhizobium sp. SARCC-RB16n]